MGLGILFVSCSRGSCPPDNPPPDPVVIVPNLVLTAPNQYPANLPYTIKAQLIITNTESFDLYNLAYSVPESNNYTGVAISISNDPTINNCVTKLAAGASCTFIANISPYANPGSFQVLVNYTGTSVASKSETNSKTLDSRSLNSTGSITLSANIGLTEVGENVESGANGISFMYPPVIPANSDPTMPIYVPIIAYVNSANAGAFNTINLTDENGNLLNFTMTSGNSGDGLSDLSIGSVVQFMLVLPPGTKTYQFFGQTAKNGTKVNQGTALHPISVVQAGLGALVVQPTQFSLIYGKTNEQIVTYTNVGSASVDSLSIQGLPSALELVENNCPSTLEPGAFCTVKIKNRAGIEQAGTTSILAHYNNGITSNIPVSSLINYKGPDAIYGVKIQDVSGANPFTFINTTVSPPISRQIKITNIGNTNESNFQFNLPTCTGGTACFTLSAGNVGTSCTISNSPVANTVANNLAVNESCVFTLTYTNSTVTPTSTSPLNVASYIYGTNLVSSPSYASSDPVYAIYQTNQAYASLSISSGTEINNPQLFTQIPSNGVNTSSYTFTVTNNGPDSANTLNFGQFTDSKYSVLSENCTASLPISSGGTCTVTVKFGPSNTIAPVNARLPITYTSTTDPNNTQFTNYIYTQGNVVSPQSPNVVIASQVVSACSVAGNGSSNANKFAFNPSLVGSTSCLELTYVNIGNYPANNFAINNSAVPYGYSYSSVQGANPCVFGNGSSNMTLSPNSANSCTVTLAISNPNISSYNVYLSSQLLGLWIDGDGLSWNNQSILWYFQNTLPLQQVMYAYIYTPPQISTYDNLSTVSPGRYLSTGGTFNIYVTLTGGYNEINQPISITGLPNTFTISNTSCSVSSASPQCIYTVTYTGTSTTVSTETYTVTNSGSVNVVTPNTGDVNVGQGITNLTNNASAGIKMGESADLTVTVNTAPSVPVFITIRPTPGGTGAPAAVVGNGCTIPAGQTTCSTKTIGVASGTTNYNASATGWGTSPQTSINFASAPFLTMTPTRVTVARQANQVFTINTSTPVTSATTVQVTVPQKIYNGGCSAGVWYGGSSCTINNGSSSCTVTLTADNNCTVTSPYFNVNATASGYIPATASMRVGPAPT